MENLDPEDPANFRPDLAPGSQPSGEPPAGVPQPSFPQADTRDPPSPQLPDNQGIPQPQAHPKHVQDPAGTSQHQPPHPSHLQPNPLHPSDHSPALPPGVFPPQDPSFGRPGLSYGGPVPPGLKPHQIPMNPRFGTPWQGTEGFDPFAGSYPPSSPPPWSAGGGRGRVRHQQMRAQGRAPPGPRPPPIRQRVQYAQQE